MKWCFRLTLVAAILAFTPLVAFAQNVPAAPINLAVTGEYEGAVAIARLSWEDQSENEVGFEIMRSDNGEDFRVVGFVGANTARYQDKVGKYITGAFTYRVRAFNEHGKSLESKTVSVWF